MEWSHSESSAFTLSDEQSLKRFLVLGSPRGVFHTKRKAGGATGVDASTKVPKKTREEEITRLIQAGHGETVVKAITEMVEEGRSIHMNACLLALAMCCRCDDKKTKEAAYNAVPVVCRSPTHLFQFVELMEQQGDTTGWGRGLRRAVSRWYNNYADNPKDLAMLVTKYRQRDGWSHHDLMRLSHMKPANHVLGFILRYVVKGLEEAKKYYFEERRADPNNPQLRLIVDYLETVEDVRKLKPPSQEKLKRRYEDVENKRKGDPGRKESVRPDSQDVETAVALIQRQDLLREHIPTFLLNSREVWSSLLDKMPLEALLRNLNKITLTGVLDNQESLQKVLVKIGSQEALRKSKVNPFAILTTWCTYRDGKGVNGRLKWDPVLEVVEALENAFYTSFGNVKPTNKRILMALNVSGSMTWERISPCDVTPRVASVAMGLLTMAVEKDVDVVGFSDEIHDLSKLKDMKLGEAIDHVNSFPEGTTNCSLPMLWATQNDKVYDAFIIFTDSDISFSRMDPADALRLYRQQSGIHNAKLAVVGMTSSDFALADPADLYMMDVVGFDSAVPFVLQEFISGFLCE